MNLHLPFTEPQMIFVPGSTMVPRLADIVIDRHEDGPPRRVVVPLRPISVMMPGKDGQPPTGKLFRDYISDRKRRPTNWLPDRCVVRAKVVNTSGIDRAVTVDAPKTGRITTNTLDPNAGRRAESTGPNLIDKV